MNKGTKNKWDKEKTNSKMVSLNPTISINRSHRKEKKRKEKITFWV